MKELAHRPAPTLGQRVWMGAIGSRLRTREEHSVRSDGLGSVPTGPPRSPHDGAYPPTSGPAPGQQRQPTKQARQLQDIERIFDIPETQPLDTHRERAHRRSLFRRVSNSPRATALAAVLLAFALAIAAAWYASH